MKPSMIRTQNPTRTPPQKSLGSNKSHLFYPIGPGPNKKPAHFLWNLEKSTKISQTTQLSSTLYSERLSIFRFREERANWYKVRSKNIHPRNLTNRYQKWWYRYQTCISFQICLFWVSILNFGRGMLIKSEDLNIKTLPWEAVLFHYDLVLCCAWQSWSC